MFYAYGPETEGWDESRKHELARRLRELVVRYRGAEQEEGEYPFVDVDEKGIHLRYVTGLNNEQQAGIKRQAEQIYRDIMLGSAPIL
jgi:hypothetical protein